MDDQHEVDCGCQEYNELSRRQFVAAARRDVRAGVLPRLAAEDRRWRRATRRIETSSSRSSCAAAPTASRLCAPFADPNYYTSRTTIAIPRPDSHGGDQGHQSRQLLHVPAGDGGARAGVPGAATCSSCMRRDRSNNSRSHFDAQRYMEVGKPADPSLVTGWLGRHLASVPPLKPDAPLRALGIANGLQKTLVGAPEDAADLRSHELHDRRVGDDAGAAARLHEVGLRCGAGADQVGGARRHRTPSTCSRRVNFTGYAPANGAVYPNTGIRSRASVGGRADQKRRRHRGGAGRHRRLGHALGAGSARGLDVPDDAGFLELVSARSTPT